MRSKILLTIAFFIGLVATVCALRMLGSTVEPFVSMPLFFKISLFISSAFTCILALSGLVKK